MKSAFQFLICFMAAVLCACSSSSIPEAESVSETISAETEESIESDNNDTIIKASESAPMSFRKSDAGSISVDSYKKPSSEGFAYELIGVDDKDLYYLKTVPVHMATTISYSEIAAVSKTDNTERSVVIIKEDSQHWVNEAYVSGDRIFWCMYEPDCIIQMYDLLTGKIKDIYTMPAGSVAVLSSGGPYITWAEWTNEDINGRFGSNGSLYVYDADTDMVSLICDDIVSTLPYARYYVKNNHCAFARIIDGKTCICRYDLKSMEYKDIVEVDVRDPENLMTYDDIIIFSDGTIDAMRPLNIYMYDCHSNTICQISSSKERINLFSFNLLDKYLILNDNSAAASIIFRDLEDADEYRPVSCEEGYFLYGRVIDDRYYINEDMKSGTIYICQP